MKYIRTKDGRIIDCVKLMNEAKKHILQNEDDYKLASVLASKTYDTDLGWQRRITAQGDTIEELCDVIVCRNELFHPLTSNMEGNEFDWEEINGFRKSVCMNEEEYNKIKETSNDFEPYFWDAYGAIWTDKGLIYVAKMNEKGELELL